MIAGLVYFFVVLVIECILGSAIMSHFSNLSEKRRRRQITEFEKLQQAIISLPAKPILQAVLSKDPLGMRLVISFCVISSGLVTLCLISSKGFMIGFMAFLLFVTWLSYPIPKQK
jgi:hypothetical protein